MCFKINYAFRFREKKVELKLEVTYLDLEKGVSNLFQEACILI